MADNVFYVCFHGLIPLLEFSDKYVAVLVQMDGHQQVYGHWLGEQSFNNDGALALTNLNSNDGTLNSATDLVVNVPSVDPQIIANLSFATITMPKPRQLLSFCTGQVGQDQPPLQGTDAASLSAYSATHVFVFDCTNQVTDVVLQRQSDGAAMFTGRIMTLPDGTTFDVLHVYNEPGIDDDFDGQHAIDEFNKAMQLYPTRNVTAVAPLPFPAQAPNTVMPSGLLLQELACLSNREKPAFQALLPARGAQLNAAVPVDGSHFCGSVNGKVGAL